MTLSIKHQAFIDSLFVHNFNGTDAYCDVYGVDRRTGRALAARMLAKDSIKKEVQRRVSEISMGADEVLLKLTEQGRADISVFFKIIEEWTFYPLPTYEIIDAKEIDILDDDGKKTGDKKINYWVRHISIDLDKVIDPRYSHLLAEFSDSPKNGLGIKIHNKQSALQILAKVHGLLIDRSENLNIDIDNCTPDELEKIVKGENLASIRKRHPVAGGG